jgi:hypothetical protein
VIAAGERFRRPHGRGAAQAHVLYPLRLQPKETPLSDVNGKFKRPPSRTRKIKPARHIGVSAEAKKAYEDIVNGRDEREKTYGRHLADADKGKR